MSGSENKFINSILPKDFYLQDTIDVAKALLGKVLSYQIAGKTFSGIVTETEAYLGIEDRGCHTFNRKRTPRTETMFMEGGVAYIYQIYGMYYCFNCVTQTKGIPEAVLVRALEPTEGIKLMKHNRKTQDIKNLTTGPGKLCQAFGLTKLQDKVDLTKGPITVGENNKFKKISSSDIRETPRIGIDYAGDHALLPLRYTIAGSEFVSKPS